MVCLGFSVWVRVYRFLLYTAFILYLSAKSTGEA